MNADGENPASKTGDGHISVVADPIVVFELAYAHISEIYNRCSLIRALHHRRPLKWFAFRNGLHQLERLPCESHRRTLRFWQGKTSSVSRLDHICIPYFAFWILLSGLMIKV